MAHIATIGEVMVELAPFPTQATTEPDLMALSFAGDTYNTAIYMARLGIQTDYVTQLGVDPYSAQILAQMDREKIGVSLINCLPGRTPGLYIIRNTPDGEREFFYWRKEAPARELFANAKDAAHLTQQLASCDCVYLSGITLAIISADARQHLLQSLRELRQQGVKIAFDSNYRPRLWSSPAEAQAAMLAIMQHTDIALLTLDDEELLWGDNTLTGCIARYQDFGISELVLKRGAKEAIIIADDQETHVPVPPVNNIVDTTGAGDTFNAGYLASRFQGGSITEAAQQGIRCAGIIIRHRGGVIDKQVFLNELKK